MSKEDGFGFPLELCCKPVPFVGLSGLDIVSNPTHRFIWDAFSKNQNHLPLLLKIIPPNHQFPVAKPKKGSYERYIPKGILKKHWMKKHLLEVPAVVAVLFDLNWDDPNWEIQKAQCIQQVQSVRSQLGGLGSKLAVILIQKVAPLPSGEDGRGAERAAALCTACDLPTKQLYVVPQDDHLQGYVVRLQNALLELAKAYYAQEIKWVKGHKEHLNKTTHRYLFVRHNFKMAYFCELKQEDRSARSFYEQAYSYVKEARPSESNLQELKLVAAFISYKLCALMFRLNEPRDALAQLRAHNKLYKPWLGPTALLFEHYAWLAVQHAAFADLFDDAIRQGLSGVQTEHPGLYYRLAANYAIDRKLVARELTQGIAGPPPDLAVTGLEYWGQRPWRPAKLAAEPLDPAAERDGVRALQASEAMVNHSALIIGYLGSGISQFKTYRCPRMRLQLLVQMAEEYHAARDHGKALTLLMHMLWDYRNEKWWRLLAVLLQRGLASAFLCPNVPDYVAFALEALAPHVPLDPQLKLQLYQNLSSVLKGEPPAPQPGGTAAETSKALSRWSSEKGGPVAVDLSHVRTCFAVHVKFTESEFQVGAPITVRITLKSFLPGPVQVTRASACLASETFSLDVDAASRDVVLDGGSEVVLDCTALCALDAGRQVGVAYVTVVLSGGGTSGRSVELKLAPQPPLATIPPEFQLLRPGGSDKEDSTMAVIAAPRAAVTMEISHSAPALLGEQFPLYVTVTNDDIRTLFHPVLEVRLVAPDNDASPDESTRLSDEQQTSISPRSIKVLLDTIAPAETARTRVHLKAYATGDRTLACTLTYRESDDVSTPGRASSLVEQQTTIPVAQPFHVSSECLTTKLEPASSCYAHEVFLLCTDVLITAPCPVTIRASALEPGLLVGPDWQKASSQLAGVTLQPGDTGRDMFPLQLREARPQPVAVGTYVLQWSREGSDDVTSSSITLPAVRCLPSPLSVAMSLPAHGRVRTPMLVTYRLHNRSSALLQLDMHVDASDAFMFAGQRQGMLRLVPESERTLEYNLYPLLSGLLALPRLVLTAPDLSDQLSAMLERSLPSHVYVMPAEKSISTASL